MHAAVPDLDIRAIRAFQISSLYDLILLLDVSRSNHATDRIERNGTAGILP